MSNMATIDALQKIIEEMRSTARNIHLDQGTERDLLYWADQLQAELDKLKAEEALEKPSELSHRIEILQISCESLRDQLAEASKDAARYRWFRECSMVRSDRMIHVTQSLYKNGVYEGKNYPSLDELDAVIDAAMKSKSNE